MERDFEREPIGAQIYSVSSGAPFCIVIIVVAMGRFFQRQIEMISLIKGDKPCKRALLNVSAFLISLVQTFTRLAK